MSREKISYRYDKDQISLRSFNAVVFEDTFDVADHERGEIVEPFADTLEHDQTQRYPHQGVGHGEQLAADRVRRRVPVAFFWKGKGGELQTFSMI